jgi:hypothetical protein
MAIAQPGEVEPPPPEEEPPVEPMPAGELLGEEPPPPPPPPPPAAEPAVTEPAADDDDEEAEEEDDDTFLDRVTGNLFIDTFFHVDWNMPDPGRLASATPLATGTALPPANNPVHRAFEFGQGFGLAFAGIDLQYESDDVLIRLDLRFGEGMNRYLGNNALNPAVNPPLSFLKQAFLRWKATDRLSLDLGQFDTFYGAEVTESWRNMNYTRGALFYLMQPFYHVGFRGSFALTDSVALNAMVVNGTATPFDNNVTPHVGVQLTAAPSDGLYVAVGYYTGAASSGFGPFAPASDFLRGSDSNDGWEHFFDLVFTGSFGDFSLAANFDLYLSPSVDLDGPDLMGNLDEEVHVFFGAMASARYALIEELALALRLEYLNDPDGYTGDATYFVMGGSSEVMNQLVTVTLTLDIQPVEQLIIRLDNRFEWSDADMFQDDDGAFRETWFSTTLGVVATMN